MNLLDKTLVGKGEYIDVEGIKTFFIRAGSGHPIVLVHGAAPGACTLVNWGPSIERLAAAGFTVYGFDQPGFGYTDDPPDYSLEYRVTHAISFLERLRLNRYHLMGNSVGAYIAARMALEDRTRGRLVLVSSGTLASKGSERAQTMAKEHSAHLRQYTPSLENARKLSMGTLFNQELVTEEFVQQRFEMSRGRYFEAQRKRSEAPPARPVQDELRNLKMKTLVLGGKYDNGVAMERTLLLFEKIPGAEVHFFDKSGHWPQWDQADRFHRVVTDFLNSPD